MAIEAYTKLELEDAGWVFTAVDNTGDWTVTVEKTVIEDDMSETLYTYAKTEVLELDAENVCILYASMVEYGLIAEHWQPKDLAFPKEQLWQFIQPDTLEMFENMYPDTVITAYNHAHAHVQSYIGAMFDIDAMLETGGNSSTAYTLRLALLISTVTFILAASPQYSDVIEMHQKNCQMLLRGLKSGNRNFGKEAVEGDPNMRVTIVSKQSGGGSRP